MSKLRIPQATAAGYIEVEEWGVFDFSYPESKTRRGRVQEGGGGSTHHHLHRRDTKIRTTLKLKTMSNQVLEQLKQEYNETVKRLQDLGEIIANCADIDTHHCGQDARSVRRGNATASSLKSLLGMQVIGIGQGKCEGCPQDNYDTPCVKVELIGGTYLCLAPTPNTTTE